MTIDFQQCRELLQDFNFQDLFIYQLGWESPAREKPVVMEVDGENYTRCKIAELAGAVVFEITSEPGKIPNAKILEAIYRDISQLHLENLLIFIDGNRTQSLWYWVKREGSKIYPRNHIYVKKQAGDLLLGKLSALRVSIEENEEITVIDIAERLQRGFNVERVTKDFYDKFQEQHTQFLGLIKGIDKEEDRRWYTSVLLNRLMFVYFLQRKGFIKGFVDDRDNTIYLQNQLDKSKKIGKDLFYKYFLITLFFEGFAKPEEQRPEPAKALIGNVKYLNGGLFLKHKIEQENPNISIPDSAFENVFNLFTKYDWNLDEINDNEISPYVLGYIFEKYINQKAFGAYYTRPEITAYLCDRTINKLILDQVNQLVAPRKFDSINDLIAKLDGDLCQRLLYEILPNISLLDPACGSGAFLIAAMQTLIYIYSSVIATIEIRIKNPSLKQRLDKERANHTSLQYYIKKQIITNNLYGVDIMPEAVEIAKLRLFLELVASAHTIDELEPLPNIDFNIMAGNSLIGLMQINEADYDSRRGQLDLFSKTYTQLLEEKNRLVSAYRHASNYSEDLQALRKNVDVQKAEAQNHLNNILLQEFKKLKIKYEQAQLSGKAKKEDLNLSHIEALKPFHWGYEFDDILQRKGGFDAIITNPPWEIFKPQAKEFFAQHSELVTKNKMDIKDFEKEQEKLLQNPEITNAWLEYQSQFPHVNAYYRSAEQYKNQISVVNSKKSGTDINLYKQFVEQCFNLLRSGGECGIVIPSGIYTDLGTKQLREMLFNQSKVTGLFCLENRKEIFEGVHRSFKIVVLTFEKIGNTTEFPSAFMRLDVQELQNFPNENSLYISVDLMHKLSPNSLSIIEFKNKLDIKIAERMLTFPFLYGSETGWNLELYGEELHMNRSAKFFQRNKTECPLYEGGMIWHFQHDYHQPHYWIKESELREVFLKKRAKRIGFNQEIPKDLKNDYEVYRLAIRKIARNTDTRTLISTIIPCYSLVGNSLSVNFPFYHSKDKYNELRMSYSDLLVISSLLNSFVVDYTLRSRMNTNLNSFYIYQLLVPRLTEGEKYFNDIVQRAAKLICTTPEFYELAQEVGLESHQQGITDETERAQLRAELDGMIAHLYGLTEEEFSYILTTFPIVPEPVKQAALEAYRTFAPMSGDSEIIELIQQGINKGEDIVEFKASAWWDIPRNRKEKFNKRISETVAAFLNVEIGGTLLIGVNDNGEVCGIEYDYNKKWDNRQNRDVYQNNLMTSLLNACDQDCGTCINISFGKVENKDVCKVTVSFSPRPVYIEDGQDQSFYIRAGNSNRKLKVKEANEYINNHWTEK